MARNTSNDAEHTSTMAATAVKTNSDQSTSNDDQLGGGADEASVLSLSSTIFGELQPPVAEQDEVITAVLNLQTALCAKVDELTLKLQQIRKAAGGSGNTQQQQKLVEKYTRTLNSCRTRLLVVQRSLDAVESRIGAAERLLFAAE